MLISLEPQTAASKLCLSTTAARAGGVQLCDHSQQVLLKLHTRKISADPLRLTAMHYGLTG